MKTLDSEILELVKEEDLAEEIEQADEFKDGVYAILVRIDHVLRSTPIVPSPTSDRSSDGSSSAMGGVA